MGLRTGTHLGGGGGRGGEVGGWGSGVFANVKVMKILSIF